jgi:hypothetical protein
MMLAEQIREQIEIGIKYHGYIARQAAEVDKLEANESTKLPPNFDYTEVRGLGFEVSQKLNQHRPETLGQASRISGVTPAAISLLLVHLKKKGMGALRPRHRQPRWPAMDRRLPEWVAPDISRSTTPRNAAGSKPDWTRSGWH